MPNKHVAFASLFAVLASTTFARVADAAPVQWTLQAAPTRASINGGPWVLGQGTAVDPLAGFPTPNPGLNFFQPYYQAFVTGTDRTLQGYFDYRIKDTREAVVAASSTDGGRTWTFQSEVLRYDSPSLTDAGAADDAGEGHPFVMTIGGHTYLYTLDRSAANVDSAGLIVREITPTSNDPVAGAPMLSQQGSSTVTRTTGLASPDGILAIVPGTSSPTKVLYVAKVLTSTPYVVTVHVAETTDGHTFTNDHVVTGLTDATTTFIGPRGTILKYADGHYGLFYSAGLVGEDADAFHFVGYAESNDLLAWTVVNGVDMPLLSIDSAKDPRMQPWYAGRVYAPNVTLSADGCTATLTFSGYKTTKPKNALNDYRQIGVVTMTRACMATDGGAPDSGTVDSGAGADSGAHDSGASGDASASSDASVGDSSVGGDAGNGATGSGSDSGCNCRTSPARGTGTGLAVVGACVALLVARRRRR